MKSLKIFGSLIAVAVVMTACGGGSEDRKETPPVTANPSDNPAPGNGGGNPTPPPAGGGGPIEGVWMGDLTWNDVTHDHPYIHDSTAIALPNGDFYHVFNHYYHHATETQRNTMGGFLVGRVTTEGGRFTVGETREFSFIRDFADRPISASGTYTSRQTLNGRLAYNPVNDPQNGQDLTRAFDVNYMSRYAGPASFGDLRFNNDFYRSIQGVLWTPQGVRADDSYKTPMHVVVNTDGSLGSRYPQECQVSGQLTPHATQKVYEARITLGANCPYQGYTFTGISFLKDAYATEHAPNASQNVNRFYLVATNNDGNVQRGLLFVQILSGTVGEEGPVVQ
ncbi:hypothetical protein [Caldimonas tepidiphila]|uniref:hypothetical protein n=1 Tax=Caldimonas tepidiphila TaxID=2315841 RepID=UPI0013009D8A|nr:hypothetical protein [Caldimonas tepidiphila]